MSRLLQAEAVVRQFGDKVIVKSVSLVLDRGESVALMGQSGCGKTTLLHMLGLLDRPDSGRVLLDDTDAWALSADGRATLRLSQIGFVFQQSNLLPNLTVRDNVALPAWRMTGNREASLQRAQELLDRFGLNERRNVRGSVLSLGEAQRVALARALVNQPALLFADEPTGSLDTQSAEAVLAAIEEVRAHGTAVLMATHDLQVAGRMQRLLRMRDGHLFESP